MQPEEISAAETFWIARAQRDLPYWRDRFNDLAPFMDGTIVRVGGRLKKKQLDYVVAERELRKLVVEGRKQINDFFVLHQVRWIFTTPHSPHQRGIYESLIKQTKDALRVAVGMKCLLE